MALGRLALDLWMASVLLSLASLGLLAAFGVVASLLTVTRAKRQARLPHDLGQLSRWYPVTELAEIDQALDRILAEEHGAEEHGAMPGPRGK